MGKEGCHTQNFLATSSAALAAAAAAGVGNDQPSPGPQQDARMGFSIAADILSRLRRVSFHRYRVAGVGN